MTAPKYSPPAAGLVRITQSKLETYLRCGIRYEFEEGGEIRTATVRMLVGSTVAAGAALDNRTKINAGEAVLFSAALSIALARQSPGRRLLLVEADPFNTGNLEALLRSLGPLTADLEALVVASAAEGWTAPAGWTIRKCFPAGKEPQ